ncbi:MAG: alpha/beta hydrolase [Verrucomicrobiota bacterium]
MLKGLEDLRDQRSVVDMDSGQLLNLGRVLLLVAAGFLAGCAGSFSMMPTPVAYRISNINLFSDMSASKETTDIDVLYVTDRKPENGVNAAEGYTDERGLALRLGHAVVKMGGEGQEWPDLERQSLMSNKRPKMRMESVEEYGKLWTTIPISDAEGFAAVMEQPGPGAPVRAAGAKFAGEINRRLANSTRDDVTVYVPGFNTSFDTPILMMAQFSHFMQRDGVFIAYSWPSSTSPFGYSKQIQRREVSVRNLREFLVYLAEETNAKKIHVVTFSAGAPLVTKALLQLRLTHEGKTAAQVHAATRLGHVIYAGADDDWEYFRNVYLDGFNDLAESITVYTSANDKGLGLSSALMNKNVRLGRVTNELTQGDLEALRQATVTSFVDVTDALKYAGKGDGFGHSYWYANPWVNTDVIAILAGDRTPSERALVREEGEALWTFPEDYPERVKAIVEEYQREQGVR